MLSRMSIDSTRFGKLLDNATIPGDFLRSSELTYFAKFIFEPYGRGQNGTDRNSERDLYGLINGERSERLRSGVERVTFSSMCVSCHSLAVARTALLS